jgi:hypothetical protein
MKPAKFIALAALVLIAADPSYGEPLRSTSIPSSLADDEKRLLPEVMNDFYGPFEKETGCWITKHPDFFIPHGAEDAAFCVKPIRLDVRLSSGRKFLFIVAGGERIPFGGHAARGILGLIVLTPNGANLGVVATNLYVPYGSWGLSPERKSVTFERLGPNGTYGWVAKWHEVHTGGDFESAEVYGVIGHSVELLTTITSYWTNAQSNPVPSTELSAKTVFETHSSASSFYPIMLTVSGIYRGSPFSASYRLVFDKDSLTYLAPNNMPDEIKPDPFIALPEPGLLSFACKGTGLFGYEQKGSIGIVVNFSTRIVQFGFNGFYHEKITASDEARVAFGEEKENGLIGTIDRVTGNAEIKTVGGGNAYSLQCTPVR